MQASTHYGAQRNAPDNATVMRRMFPPRPSSQLDGLEDFSGLNAYFEDCYSKYYGNRSGSLARVKQDELLEIINYLHESSNTYDQIKEKIAAKFSIAEVEDSGLLDHVLLLAARIWCTLEVGTIPQYISQGTKLQWSSGTLRNALENHFSGPSETLERCKLPNNFIATNLEKIAHIKICWTSNLLDHLRLMDEATTVLIFHQVTFLKLHLRYQSSFFPEGLIEETLTTLKLLLPKNDRVTQSWFRRNRMNLPSPVSVDPAAAKLGHLESSKRYLNEFKFWGDRLSVLKQAFDESEPRSIKQWWYDDRKRVQWYTFWIAALVLVLTIIFGVAQTTASGIQAWASLKALEQAQKQQV